MGGARSNRLTDLGELQLAVLERLSEAGEATVYDVLRRFPRRSRPRYTTALTVLRSLEQKGLVTHEERDRAYVFRPTVDVAVVRRRLLRSIINRVFGGSPRDLVTTLMDVDGITPEILEELKEVIAAKGAGNDGR